MGVKHSKQSVDISSTPKKPGAPVEEINGKTVEEKVEETKVRFPHHLCNFMLSLIQIIFDRILLLCLNLHL